MWVKAIYRNSFRPLYLIFDQFEELFILGNKKEQTDFFDTVSAILNLEQPVKLIFSIREEYIGRLYDFEKEVPQLMRNKLHVESMDFGKVKEVITGAAKVPRSVISLKVGEDEGIALSIFTKMGGKDKSDTIQLPYLQVFLDKVYKDITKGMPDMTDAVFTKGFIEVMPAIGDILGDCLESQVKAISETLKVDDKPVTAEPIWGILSPFATLQGTMALQSIEGVMKELPKGADGIIVAATVIELVTGRILKDKDKNDVYELMLQKTGYLTW